jgi:hypothetical protein
MKSSFRGILTCLLLALSPDARAAPEEKPVAVTLRVAAVAISGEMDTLWLATSPGESAAECRLNIRSFSEAIQVKVAGDRLLFHATREAAEASPPRPPLVTLPLAGVPAGLLLFFPEKNGYQAMRIPEGEAGFGSFLLINTTRAKLLWQVAAAKPVVVEPGQRSVIPAPDGKPLPVKLAAELAAGGSKLIRNTTWQIDPDQREFVIVHGEPERPRFHHLVDFRKEEAAP